MGEGRINQEIKLRATKMKIRTISQYWYHKRIINGFHEKDQKVILEKINKSIPKI